MDSKYATTTSGKQVIVNGDGTWVPSGELNGVPRETPTARVSGIAPAFLRSSWSDFRALVVQAEGKEPDGSTPGVIGYEASPPERLRRLTLPCASTGQPRHQFGALAHRRHGALDDRRRDAI